MEMNWSCNVSKEDVGEGARWKFIHTPVLPARDSRQALGGFRTLTLDSPESADLTFVFPLLPTDLETELAFSYWTRYSSPYRIAGVQALFRLNTCCMSIVEQHWNVAGLQQPLMPPPLESIEVQGTIGRYR